MTVLRGMGKEFDIFLSDQVQEIFDYFSACFGVRILFLDPEGREMRVGLNRPNSSYCQWVQEQIFGDETCRNLDVRESKKAEQRGERVCYECHAGCRECIVPVQQYGEVLGFIMIGQFRKRKEPPPRMRRKCSVAEGGETRLRELFSELPFVKVEQEENLLGLFSVLVDYIHDQHMITRRGKLLVQRICDYQKRKIDMRLTLDAAAKLVNRSPSTVSHIFRNQVGISFKQAMINLKLDHADYLLTQNPELRISEVANAVGYKDPFLFSRIYSKYRGFPPSAQR